MKVYNKIKQKLYYGVNLCRVYKFLFWKIIINELKVYFLNIKKLLFWIVYIR